MSHMVLRASEVRFNLEVRATGSGSSGPGVRARTYTFSDSGPNTRGWPTNSLGAGESVFSSHPKSCLGGGSRRGRATPSPFAGKPQAERAHGAYTVNAEVER